MEPDRGSLFTASAKCLHGRGVCSRGKLLDESMNAVRANNRSPADFDGLKVTVTNQFVDFGGANAERFPCACNGDGERFHYAVSKLNPHSAGSSTAHD
jgi:hypothetical protein